MTSEQKTSSLKERALEELKEFTVLFLYLLGILAIFRTYTALILFSTGASLTHYGFALITALIGAKVILLTQNLEITKMYENRDARILSATFKTAAFFLFMVAFTFVEKGVEGMFHHEGFMGGVAHAVEGAGVWQILASNTVIVAALFPLFLIREVDRALGSGTLLRLVMGESRRTVVSELGDSPARS